MKTDLNYAGCGLLITFFLVGCPTRPNPLLSGIDANADTDVNTDADVDTDGDADGGLDADIAEDAELDADSDVGPDADLDADGDNRDADVTCSQPGQVICDGECVWVNTKARCGDCDTQCEAFTSCRCEQYGDTYRCWSNSDSTTCEAE
jgi:hypothetical protein